MKYFRLTKGLALPIAGAPVQAVSDAARATHVALVGPDYVGLKPKMAVQVGDVVKTGQLLFEDKKTPGSRFTSPGGGTIVAINRGEKRAFQSIVVELDTANGEASETFASYGEGRLDSLTAEQVTDNLVLSGLWTALRTRPFSRVPSPETTPHSLFVTAIDTNPLCPAPEVVIGEAVDEFLNGLRVLGAIRGERLYLCRRSHYELPGEDLPGVEPVVFDGPHPAGLPGTHIHFVDPVDRQKTVWHIGYQDVIAIGRLFTTGRLDTERVIALGGPSVKNPRLLRTRLGAPLEQLLADELTGDRHRVVSGSVLGGREADGPLGYLGRYHQQVTVLPELIRRELFGWMMPGLNKASLSRTLVSSFLWPRRMPLNTALNGGHRAVFPIDSFEKVMPLDLLPIFLFRSMAIGDIEESEKLGCLELAEEDLALCTFACPGKNDYGALLRETLNKIEKEG